MTCVICNNPARPIFEKHGYWICECSNCGHRFTQLNPSSDHIENVYNNSYFEGGEAGYSNYLGEREILLAHGRRYGALVNTYMAPGAMLDVGAAAGFLLKGFQDKGWQGQGVEPNASMAAYGSSNLGVQIQTGSLEGFSTDRQFDLVSMIQVIAHFFNIREALQKAADITCPGGFWLIETWDKDSWMARALGQNWHEYSPPSVLHFFSPKSLKQLVSQYGFVEVARGRPQKRISGEHAKSLLEYKLEKPPLSWLRGGLKIVPDQLSIPYPAFDLFWMLFQKRTDANS